MRASDTSGKCVPALVIGDFTRDVHMACATSEILHWKGLSIWRWLLFLACFWPLLEICRPVARVLTAIFQSSFVSGNVRLLLLCSKPSIRALKLSILCLQQAPVHHKQLQLSLVCSQTSSNMPLCLCQFDAQVDLCAGSVSVVWATVATRSSGESCVLAGDLAWLNSNGEIVGRISLAVEQRC